MTEEKKNSTSVGEKTVYMATVKVGSRGQIVIPQKARQLLHIKPGDMLLMRADSSLGIAIQPLDMVGDLFDDLFRTSPN